MTPTKTRPHKPMLAEWTGEIFCLSHVSADQGRHKPSHDTRAFCKKAREFIPDIRRTLKEHVPLIPQSLSATEPAHTPVARQTQMAALLNWQQMRAHAKFENPLQLCRSHRVSPVIWGYLLCRTREPTVMRIQLQAWTRARPRVQKQSLTDGLLLHLNSQW